MADQIFNAFFNNNPVNPANRQRIVGLIRRTPQTFSVFADAVDVASRERGNELFHSIFRRTFDFYYNQLIEMPGEDITDAWDYSLEHLIADGWVAYILNENNNESIRFIHATCAPPA